MFNKIANSISKLTKQILNSPKSKNISLKDHTGYNAYIQLNMEKWSIPGTGIMESYFKNIEPSKTIVYDDILSRFLEYVQGFDCQLISKSSTFFDDEEKENGGVFEYDVSNTFLVKLENPINGDYMYVYLRFFNHDYKNIHDKYNVQIDERLHKYSYVENGYRQYTMLDKIQMSIPMLATKELKEIYDIFRKKITSIMVDDCIEWSYETEYLPKIGYLRPNPRGGYQIDTFDNDKINFDETHAPYDILYGNGGEKMYSEFVDSILNNTKGISILYGPPGTGKTSFIRRVINDSTLYNKMFIFLELQTVLDIPMNNLLDLIESKVSQDKNAVIVIEDADDLIKDRKLNEDKKANNIISSILNLSDGIFNDFYTIQFLLTHNRKSVDIDPAIKRKNRLTYEKEFKELTVEESNAFLKHHESPRTVSEPTTLGDLFFIINNEAENIKQVMEPSPEEEHIAIAVK